MVDECMLTTHSPMHSAAYALDPEFLGCSKDFDEATQLGLLTVIERLCLRDAILDSGDASLILTSPAVISRVAQAE